ncbi:MAG: alanyl-tRNA editing protein [Anaerolineae bacterium]|jgi:misacylated tRNA(Ala) deacylase
MTDLLYHSNSYLREFEATVTEVVGDGVLLSRTAFFPGGGGQPNDVGWLEFDGELWEVPKVKRTKGGVVHILERASPPISTPVRGILDWNRRYALMRTHTAMHILCGVIWRDYGASVTGGKMKPLEGRMDFEFERMQRELVEEIEEKINVEVAAARPISVRTLPREEAFQIPDLIRTKINLLPEHIREVRVVEIEGLDLQADGGTHVANTEEVGPLWIADYKSKGRINKRLVVALDD